MGRIRVLHDRLIDRIAAGEVVERPASVVKELIENSLDAGASRLDVRLASGGKQLIEVSDDGSGMDADDAVLALERHATSKIGGPEDLDAIATLGFRGEALASIAAVSRLTLATALADGEGTEVEVRAGRIVHVRRMGLPRGTTVRVERLFLNVPARRKFLKSEPAELTHIVRWVTRSALARPALRLRLQHGDRRLIEVGPAADRLERIAQLHGSALAGRLLPASVRRNGIHFEAFAGRPVDGLAHRNAQHWFVNGRPVQDRLLTHAAMRAYANTMPAGRSPMLFLFLDLDPREVDVNVHPQKIEVRFQNPGDVHGLVEQALSAALAHRIAVPALGELRPREPIAVQVSEPRPVAPAGAEAVPREPVQRAPVQLAVRVQDEPPDRGPTPRALAQLHHSYILAEDPEGLVLVDQHAAHERVLFERFLERANAGDVELQRLLFPPVLELGPTEQVVAEAEAGELERLGFRLEPFGTRAVRLDAIPAVAGALDPEKLLRELLGEASRARAAAADVPELRRRLVTSAACQAAIKVHHPLAQPAMQALLEDLQGTANRTTCPHGRPVVFRLSLDSIERAFRRR